MNLFQAVNSAIDIALETDSTYIILNSALKYSERMSNSEESFDALMDFARDMELTEFLILPYQNRVFLDLQLDSLYPGTQLSQKYNSEIISSPHSIK